MSSLSYTGNAFNDAPEHRGWIIGHFMAEEDVRHSRDVEVKWSTHPAGDERQQWTQDDVRPTVVVLISGNFVVELSTETAELTRAGDYVMWGPGVDHAWRAVEDSVVLTVRWPSVG